MNPRLNAHELPQRIWQELQRAPLDKHHPWRTPVLATVDAQGLPQARTVVLRQTDIDGRTLVFFTDARSPKCAELRAQPMATLVCWHPRLNWQLRIQAQAQVIDSGPAVEAAWARVQASPAASDYLAPHPPGHALPSDAAATADTHHLALVRLAVLGLDWLELDRAGHRRARIDGDQVHWLVP